MCGIAGAVDLRGDRTFDAERLRAMLRALAHRGPDGEGQHIAPGVALGARRLALVDPARGAQPVGTPEGDAWAVANAEIFNDTELRSELESRGDRFASRCDTEIWPHLVRRWGAGALDRVRGQFAVAVWDATHRRLLLARDRHGICPLHVAEADGFLLFASEVRGLFASGLLAPRPFAPAIDALFTHYAMPPRWSAFEGVRSIAPGSYLEIEGGRVREMAWWRPRFDEPALRPPSRGAERDWARELDGLLARAVSRRLRGDAKVASYLSGGVDSSMVATLAARGGVRDFFHVVPDGAGPDESAAARRTASDLGGTLHELRVDGRAILDALPEATDAAEHPIVDTSNGCLLRLAQRVKSDGFSVALSGEGADECFGGYFWTRVEAVVSRVAARAPFDVRGLLRFVTTAGLGPSTRALPIDAAQSLLYDPLASARSRFYRGALAEAARDRIPIDAWSLPIDALRALGPMRRSLYIDWVVALPGHLLLGKGDRVAMRSAVELRYPFLDEDVVDFCARLPVTALVSPSGGKRLLRTVAAARGVRAARTGKTMFRADRSSLLLGQLRPPWVDELLSRASLDRVGWFDADVVERERARRPSRGPRTPREAAMDACLTLVVTTQLWHHAHFGGGLCRL